MGIYVVIGASLLGVFSGMLIVWSLWTRSQARKRQQLATGQHAAIAPVSAAYPVAQGNVGDEPKTEFMSQAELFGQTDEPTQFLSEADVLGASAEDEHEATTAFMTEDELFGEDEDEVPTAFMSSDDLLRRAQAPVDATVVLAEGAIEPPLLDGPPMHRSQDDDGFDDDDPATELVQQAEIMRLMGQNKRPD